jgi:hypothetical protein
MATNIKLIRDHPVQTGVPQDWLVISILQPKVPYLDQLNGFTVDHLIENLNPLLDRAILNISPVLKGEFNTRKEELLSGLQRSMNVDDNTIYSALKDIEWDFTNVPTESVRKITPQMLGEIRDRFDIFVTTNRVSLDRQFNAAMDGKCSSRAFKCSGIFASMSDIRDRVSELQDREQVNRFVAPVGKWLPLVLTENYAKDGEKQQDAGLLARFNRQMFEYLEERNRSKISFEMRKESLINATRAGKDQFQDKSVTEKIAESTGNIRKGLYNPEKDYLYQDPVLYGQDFALLSYVNPTEIVQIKDIFYFTQFYKNELETQIKAEWSGCIKSFNVVIRKEFQRIEDMFEEREERKLLLSVRKIKDSFCLNEENIVRDQLRSYNFDDLCNRYKDFLTEKRRELTQSDLLYGLKIRGAFGSLVDAKAHGERCHTEFEPEVHTYVVSNYSWNGLDINPDEAEDQVYSNLGNNEVDGGELMKRYHNNLHQKRVFDSEMAKKAERQASSKQTTVERIRQKLMKNRDDKLKAELEKYRASN